MEGNQKNYEIKIWKEFWKIMKQKFGRNFWKITIKT